MICLFVFLQYLRSTARLTDQRLYILRHHAAIEIDFIIIIIIIIIIRESNRA